jgi:hypothetical protein
MFFLNRHNLKAAGIHLLISAGLALISIYCVYGLWYSAPLSTALEVGNIFLMLLGIDIILGPIMTLVVYKPHKSSLKFDLTVIACIQLMALLYGLNTVGSARPAYMVFTKDRFDLVLAHEVASVIGTPETPKLQLHNPWAHSITGYTVVSATLPTDVASYPLLNLLTNSGLNGGPDVPNLPEFHRPYSEALPKIRGSALKLAELKAKDSKDVLINTDIKMLQAKYPTDSLLVPLKIKFTIYTVIVNSADGKILGIEPVDVF